MSVLVNAETGEIVDGSLQVMPILDPDVLAALRDSIQRFGVLVPIVMDQHGRIIDGHNRHAIADEFLVDCPTEVRIVGSDEEALELARTLNEDRRHLDGAARARLVQSLRERGHSLRAIAGALGVNPVTVLRDVNEDLGHMLPDATCGQDRIDGADGKTYPPSHRGWTDEEIRDINERLANGESHRQVAEIYEVSKTTIGKLIARTDPANPEPLEGKTRSAIANRQKKIREMAASGSSSRQIAESLNIHRSTVVDHAKRLGIEIPADAIVGNTRRLDSNRIVSTTVIDMEATVMGLDLVNLDDLDPDQIEGWVISLNDSLRRINRFHKQMKEMTRDEG